MDEILAKELIEVGKEAIKEFTNTKNDVKELRSVISTVQTAIVTLTTLLKGNGSKGFLKRLEELEGKTLLRNPLTYISLAALGIAVAKMVLG